MKSLVIFCVLLFFFPEIKANPDTTRNEKTNRMIVEALRTKCGLPDSITTKLTMHFQKYENAWQLCHLTNDHCGYLAKEQDEGILRIF